MNIIITVSCHLQNNANVRLLKANDFDVKLSFDHELYDNL